MAKFLDLYNKAKSDLDSDRKSDEAVAQAAQEKQQTAQSVSQSSPELAQAIKAAGGYVINTSVSPPTLLVSTDGQSFMEVGASTTDDDVPQQQPQSPMLASRGQQPGHGGFPNLVSPIAGPQSQGPSGGMFPGAGSAPMSPPNPGNPGQNPVIAPRQI